MQVSKLAQTCAPAGFRHAREAEIDAIGEDDGAKRIAIVGLPARTSVDEAFAEPGPSIDLKQQGGDLHPWPALTGCATGNFGRGRGRRLPRTVEAGPWRERQAESVYIAGADVT